MGNLRERLPPPFRTVLGVLHEWLGALRLAADLSSTARMMTDTLLFRLLGLVHVPGEGKERCVRLKDGVEITYRLDRGDIQSIREVWIDEAYDPPFPLEPNYVVDLGANIGLTTLWLSRRYRAARFIAVEPSAGNARLARINFERNQVAADLIEAAIGPRDGSVRFEGSRDSNRGRLGSTGDEVSMVSMSTLLRRIPEGTNIDLMKMDIEGGEQELLTGDVAWLVRVRSIIAEFHPEVVDYPGLIKRLERAGFRYLSPALTGRMDSFVRNDA